MTVGAIDYTQLARALIAQSLALPQSTKAVSSTPTTTYGHGPGGLFSHPALERPLISAFVLPRGGLQARLPLKRSRYSNPLYGLITGVTATSGSEPTGVCDDPPVAGLVKLCMQSYTFGRFSRMSRVFDIDRMGLLTDRGEHTDFQLVGDPFGGSAQSMVPTMPGFAGAGGMFNSEVGKALFELAVAWQRDFADVIYTGNPSNNTSGGGYKEFRGLDNLINTGYRDAESAQACAAADSLVRSMNNANVSTGNTAIVRNMTAMFRYLKQVAERAGLAPVKWVLAMRSNLFYELTEVWPCSYATYRCSTVGGFSTSQVNMISADRLEVMRREMRQGEYLLIDDEKVEVVIDNSITETSLGTGAYHSPIYFVPMTVLGSTEVTWLDYLDYDMPNGAMEAARAFAPEGSFQTSDGGRFLWHRKPTTNWCVQFLAKTEPRLILRTPHLAARLTNVAYTPVIHEREWDPASPYFLDGGRTDRNGYGPSYWSPTA